MHHHEETKPEVDPSFTPKLPIGLWDRFKNCAQRAYALLHSAEQSKELLHPDFKVIRDGWHWSTPSALHRQPEFKVQFLFNREDFAKLDNCPSPAKIAVEIDQKSAFMYCGFAYPRSPKELSQLIPWAARFPEAAVFTYGKLGPSGWEPGELRRTLSPVDELIEPSDTKS